MRVGLGFDRRDASTDALASVIHRAVAEALRGASGLDTPLPGTSEADARDALETGARRGAGSAEGELREAVRLIERHNHQVVNLDITVLADVPYPEAALYEIRERVAELVHISPANVVTKKSEINPTPWLEAGNGVAAIAITLLDQISDLDALHASIRSGG
ncbi:MAG: 2-C-methyl-D-erythritol 2,4-cyclodiphosphate synthase [Gemmatimonadota bacterium]